MSIMGLELLSQLYVVSRPSVKKDKVRYGRSSAGGALLFRWWSISQRFCSISIIDRASIGTPASKASALLLVTVDESHQERKMREWYTNSAWTTKTPPLMQIKNTYTFQSQMLDMALSPTIQKGLLFIIVHEWSSAFSVNSSVVKVAS